MPFNGSGTFTRVHDWTTDRDNSVKITASRADAEDDGFATGLSNCITKDGQTTVTANIPFNAKKLTGVADPTAAQDAATKNYADTTFLKLTGGTLTGELTVNSHANVDAVYSEFGIDRSSASLQAFDIRNTGAGAMELRVDNVKVPTISSTDTLTNKTLASPVTTGQILAANGTQSLPSITFSSDPDTGIYRFAPNQMGLVLAGSTMIHLNANGVQFGGAGVTVDIIRDEDTMVSDDAAALATQQSIKAYVDSKAIVRATSQTATGTSITFSSLPSGLNRITVMFNAVSMNGAEDLMVQIGDSGGVETTGYISTASDDGGNGQTTAGFICSRGSQATDAHRGSIILSRFNGNNWVAQGSVTQGGTSHVYIAGQKSLSGTLDRVHIRPTGTNTFDSGSLNIMYEG